MDEIFPSLTGQQGYKMIELICWLTGFDYEIIESLSFWFWTITGISIVVGIIVTGKNWMIKDEWDNRNR